MEKMFRLDLQEQRCPCLEEHYTAPNASNNSGNGGTDVATDGGIVGASEK